MNYYDARSYGIKEISENYNMFYILLTNDGNVAIKNVYCEKSNDEFELCAYSSFTEDIEAGESFGMDIIFINQSNDENLREFGKIGVSVEEVYEVENSC